MQEQFENDYDAFVVRRRKELLERIADAASRSGRNASDITLLAVSKTVDTPKVEVAYRAGYRLFGENRPQELKRKAALVRQNPALTDVVFHMIGNLQKNKINQVLGNAALIHSVSSLHLAQAIASRSCVRGTVTPCLLEVNVSGEASKSGFSGPEITRVVEQVMDLDGISIEGVMTMAPAHNPEGARSCFAGLRKLSEDLRQRTGMPLPILSCGMSGDFEIAIEEGSTLVRLGRIVFDPTYEDV